MYEHTIFEKDKPIPVPSHYFTQFTCCKAFLYILCLIYVSAVCVLSFLQPFVFDVCKNDEQALHLDYENPHYDQRLCTRRRSATLLYLTPEEVSFSRRIVVAVLLGGLIGWERRSADRPAGIRTMSLVSLGACLFSVCSAYAFIEGPMRWDGSRVAAAIPSGVGFLGAGIIWKQAGKDDGQHTVHGLTTAASIWLSAAVGIACSGELYFAATFSVAIVLILLRFGPRLSDDDLQHSNHSLAASTGMHLHDIESSRSRSTRTYHSFRNGNHDNDYGTVEKDKHVSPEELECLRSCGVGAGVGVDVDVNGTHSSPPQHDCHDFRMNTERLSFKKNSSRKKKPSLME